MGGRDPEEHAHTPTQGRNPYFTQNYKSILLFIESTYKAETLHERKNENPAMAKFKAMFISNLRIGYQIIRIWIRHQNFAYSDSDRTFSRLDCKQNLKK